MYIAGISEIYLVKAATLPEYVRELYAMGEMPWIALDIMPIDHGPGATAYSERQMTPEGLSVNSELSFSSGELPISTAHDLAFIIVAADGIAYLIGSKEPPFPMLKTKKDLSNPADGKAGFHHTFTWAGPLIPILLIYPSFEEPEE